MLAFINVQQPTTNIYQYQCTEPLMPHQQFAYLPNLLTPRIVAIASPSQVPLSPSWLFVMWHSASLS